MCGRFNLIATPAELSELFAMRIVAAPPPRYNIAPSQPVVALRRIVGRDQPMLDILQWGLVPAWAKDPNVAYRMINARSETAAEKPSFRHAFKYRRCLIPATGFYEWKGEGSAKQPFHFRLSDGRPFAFAGLWEHWQNRDGSELETCTILTTAANPFMAKYHLRMPVILRQGDFGLWIDPTVQTAVGVRHLLNSFPAQMEAVPVGRLINSPANDSPAVIEPYAAAPQMSLMGEEKTS